MTENTYANRLSFYAEIISLWIPDRNATVLVVGGGPNDQQVFESLGFHRVTFTNVDSVIRRTQGDAPSLAAADADSRLEIASARFILRPPAVAQTRIGECSLQRRHLETLRLQPLES